MTIYDKVKALADARGLSIAEVERTAGVANGTVGKWRNGQPMLETLCKIAGALDTDITVFVGKGME